MEDELARTLGADFRAANQGACYLMPHPHGEPHFFVKLWAFTETPAGWSSIIKGVRGPSWDVMRGVVWTDRFHATPAVFSLQVGRRVQIAAGAALLDVVPFPRSLAARASRSSAKADHGLRAQRPPTRR